MEGNYICGIAGVIKWGQHPITEEMIALLLVGNEHRGNDASGIVIQQKNGSLDVFKKDRPGWVLVTSSEYKAFIREKLKADSASVLIHARGASQGNPRDNNNNHPMYAGKSAVIHNGVIRNDSELFDAMKLERKAETDSDIIRAIIDAEGFDKEVSMKLARLAGSGAIAAVHPDYPGKVLLVRSGNPLTLASNDDFMFFSSEKNTLHKACRPFVKRMGIWFQAQKPNVDFAVMADDTCWLIGPKGLEWHEQCRICMKKYEEPWRKTYQEYRTRQMKWNTQAGVRSSISQVHVRNPTTRNLVPSKLGWCMTCRREWLIPFGGKAEDFTCNTQEEGCGKHLSDLPERFYPEGMRIN